MSPVLERPRVKRETSTTPISPEWKWRRKKAGRVIVLVAFLTGALLQFAANDTKREPGSETTRQQVEDAPIASQPFPNKPTPIERASSKKYQLTDEFFDRSLNDIYGFIRTAQGLTDDQLREKGLSRAVRVKDDAGNLQSISLGYFPDPSNELNYYQAAIYYSPPEVPGGPAAVDHLELGHVPDITAKIYSTRSLGKNAQNSYIELESGWGTPEFQVQTTADLDPLQASLTISSKAGKLALKRLQRLTKIALYQSGGVLQTFENALA